MSSRWAMDEEATWQDLNGCKFHIKCVIFNKGLNVFFRNLPEQYSKSLSSDGEVPIISNYVCMTEWQMCFLAFLMLPKSCWMSEGSANLKAEHVMIYIIANNYCSSLGIGEVN